MPAHLRARTNHWIRLDPTLTIGTGKGVQVYVSVPVYLQQASTRYTETNGLPYEPTYPWADPLPVVRGGLADARAGFRVLGSVGQNWTVGGGVGLSLPTAPPPDNPRTSADADLTRTFQAGSGTFDPTIDLLATTAGERWGAWFGLSGRFGLYTTRLGYRPPTLGLLSVGPSIRVAPKATLLITADMLLQTAMLWNGQPDGGRVALSPSVVGIFPVLPTVVLQARASVTAWQQSLSPDRDPRGPLAVLSVGVSYTPKPRDTH